MHCESANEFEATPESGFVLADGVAGRACVTADMSPKPRIAGKGVPVSKRQPLTIAAWLRPSEADTDVALLSDVDYATNPAATTYGKGIELRFIGGELEFRFGDRLPAYLIRVRSAGAGARVDEPTGGKAGVCDGADVQLSPTASVRMSIDLLVSNVLVNGGPARTVDAAQRSRPVRSTWS